MVIDVFIAQQVLGFVLDDLGQRQGVLLHRHPGLVDLVAENEGAVAAVLVADIDLVSESEERPVLREGRVVAAKIDRRVLCPRIGENIGERDPEVGERCVQVAKRRIEDIRFVSAQRRRRLVHRDSDPIYLDWTVVQHIIRAIDVEIENLAGEGRGVAGHRL